MGIEPTWGRRVEACASRLRWRELRSAARSSSFIAELPARDPNPPPPIFIPPNPLEPVFFVSSLGRENPIELREGAVKAETECRRLVAPDLVGAANASSASSSSASRSGLELPQTVSPLFLPLPTAPNEYSLLARYPVPDPSFVSRSDRPESREKGDMLDNPIPVLLNPIPASEGECDSPQRASSRSFVRPSRSPSSQPENCEGVGRDPRHPFESNVPPCECECEWEWECAWEVVAVPPMAEE